MPDILNAEGLTTKTATEITEELEEGLKEIYGNDININSNSPDGQMINIFAQACTDIRELITEVYNSMDPDKAIGDILKRRCSYNNIKAREGTYTIQPVSITVDRTVTLDGLDTNLYNPSGTGFTVSDDTGNQFILSDTTTFTSGTTSAEFRASQIGKVETTPDTITNTITKVLGVTSVNNPLAATSTGVNEESDTELRIRRERSVSIASDAFLDGLRAALLNLDNVTDAIVYENDTSSVDIYGIPAHSIWAIVENGDDDDIADIIYTRKTPGTGMHGDEEVEITTVNGSIATIKFDRPEDKRLYLQFDIQTIISGSTFDEDNIKAEIVSNLTYGIGEYVETSLITAVTKDAIETYNGESGVPVNVEISDDGASWVDYLTVDTLDEKWVLSTDDITITVVT